MQKIRLMTFNHYAILIFVIAAIACAGYYTWHMLRLRAQVPAAAEGGRTQSRLPPVAFRPLAILFVLIAVIIAAEPFSTYYKGAIVLGLCLALLADLLYIVPGTPQLVHLGHLTIIYALYATAFASQMSLQIPTIWTVILLVLAGGIYYLIHEGLTFLRVFYDYLYGSALFDGMDRAGDASADAGHQRIIGFSRCSAVHHCGKRAGS